MAQLLADRNDIDFVLHEQFNLAALAENDVYSDFTRPVIDMIISEVRKLSIKELLPTNEIGDKSGMCYTWHNIASIAYENNDLETYFKNETPAYQTALEIRDAYLIFGIGRDFGYLLAQIGHREEGIAILQRSLSIGQQAGMAGVEQVAALLKKLGAAP